MEKYVLEYSTKQKAFHRSTIDEMLQNNMHTFEKKLDNPWIPIAIGTWEEMAKLGKKLQEELYGKNMV